MGKIIVYGAGHLEAEVGQSATQIQVIIHQSVKWMLTSVTVVSIGKPDVCLHN